MNKALKKLTAVALALTLTLCTGMLPAFAEETDQFEKSAVFRGAYYYCPGNGVSSEAADRMDYYVYSDDYFCAPSTEYNAHLASMSMALSAASASTARGSGYTRQSRNLSALLEDVGFADFESNSDYRSKPTVTTAAAACAHQRISCGNKAFTLLAVVPRSAGYGAELGNSVLFGTKGNASGFNAAATKILSFVRTYSADNGLQGEIKLWTAGYDRGAAIASLIAKSVIDNPAAALGTAVTLSPENIYAYTFGTPAAADGTQNPATEKYSMIYHHISDADILSVLPPAEMGFGRPGAVKIINSKANKNRMKELLAVCNPDVYAEYVGNNVNPDAFTPKRVTSSFSIVDDASSYMPKNARDYLAGLSEYTALFSGGRSGYYTGGEQALSAVLAYYGGLGSDKAAAFTEALVNSKDMINCIFSMYAYFVKLKSTGAVYKSAKEPAAVSASDSEFSELELYELLLRLVRYKNSSADSILSDASGYLKSSLTAAMKASGAASSQISSVTTTANMKALARFLACLFFGNKWQSNTADLYDYTGSEQIKNAVTLLENADLLAADHRVEVMLSWLRAADSYYDDYAELTASQRAGYRRVYLPNAVSGEVFNAAGEKTAQISGGALVNCSDVRLGFTFTDNGGFLRLPSDEAYQIELHAETAGTLDITIDEYSCNTALATTALKKSAEVSEQALITVALPADGAYSVTITEPCVLGDANSDGRITICDVTAIQRHLAQINPLTGAAVIAADVNGDGEVTIEDATEIQSCLAEYGTGYPIGEPQYAVY